MLNYSPWKIEQSVFSPADEADLEKQLAFSNGYISQYAFFEEHYSGNQSLGTYLRGIPAKLPPVATLSVRLDNQRLNLHNWQVLNFYRCLHRQEPLLERRVVAKSPQGHTLEVRSSRLLSSVNPREMLVEYEVRSLDYSGPVSLLSLMGDAEVSEDWFPLYTHIDNQSAEVMCLSRRDNVQMGLEMTTDVYKNGELLTDSRIRIEKSHILGYSLIDTICPEDVFLLKKKVLFSDSVNYPELCKTSW